MARIIAIGGGEIKLGETRAIDEEIIKACPKVRPKLDLKVLRKCLKNLEKSG